MTRFVDIYPPSGIVGYPTKSSPAFSTTLVGVSSGAESANSNWSNPLHKFELTDAIRCHEHYEDLKDFWWAMAGPYRLFPFRDPMDFSSSRLLKANLARPVTAVDQVLGVADGINRVFQLRKAYQALGAVDTVTNYRSIDLPILDTVALALDGLAVAPADYTVTRKGGVVTFTVAPLAGKVLTGGFLFDVPSRFDSDTELQGIQAAFQLTGFASVTYVEKRLC